MKKARLALEEPFGMKRVVQFEQFIVEMMAEFVQHSSKKRAEGYDLFMPSRPHPDGNSSALSALCDLIQPVKFPPGIARAYSENFNHNRRHVQTVEKAFDELANQAFNFDAIFSPESLLELFHHNL